MTPKQQAKAWSKAQFDACLNKGGIIIGTRAPQVARKYRLEAGVVVAS